MINTKKCLICKDGKKNNCLQPVFHDFQHPARRAALVIQHFPGGLAELFPALRVIEQRRKLSTQAGGVLHPHGSILIEKELSDVTKIVHVRPEKDGLRPICRLEDVVPAGWDQTPSHKDRVGELKDSCQFSNRIEEQYLSALDLRCEGLLFGGQAGALDKA